MACTDDYECDVEGSEYLRTVCCFIQSLRFYGYDKSAATLAVQAIICYLPVLSLSADVSSVTNGLLNAIRKCHNETGVHLWGEDDSGDDDDDDHSRDPILLCTLLQAVVHDDNSWEICCNTPLTCSSDSESDENCDFPYSDTVSLPLPVYVLLECIKSIPDGFQVDSIGQLDFVVELNKLLVSATNRIKSLSLDKVLKFLSAVERAILPALADGDNPVKLAFLFRVRLSDYEISAQTCPDFVSVCDYVDTLNRSLTDKIEGEGSNEDFFLALSDYSSFLLQTIRVCRSLNETFRSRVITRSIPDIDISSLNLFVARGRFSLFLHQLLWIATVICPTVGLAQTCASHSLDNQLEVLKLPSYSRDCERANETSYSRVEREKIEGDVACRIIAYALTLSVDGGEVSRFTPLRSLALRGLSEVAAVIGATTVLEIVEVVGEESWLYVMSWHELINHVLFEPKFIESFKSRACEDLSPTVEKVIREVILDRLYALPRDDVLVQDVYYQSVRKLGLTSLLTGDILGDIRDTSMLCYQLLFQLSIDLRARPSTALKMGVEAYKTMRYYLILKNECAFVPRSPSSFALLLCAAHCLGASAMQLDLDATPSGAMNFIFHNTDRVLTIVTEQWQDALITFHVVAEMARIYQEKNCQCLEASTIQQPETALSLFIQVNRMVPRVLNRCKEAILATLAKDKHIGWWYGHLSTFSDWRIDSRLLTGDDFLCLRLILQALPDPNVDLQSLISHSALCLWRNAATSYFSACRPGSSRFQTKNCYESYYEQLICEKSVRKRLFAKQQSED